MPSNRILPSFICANSASLALVKPTGVSPVSTAIIIGA